MLREKAQRTVHAPTHPSGVGVRALCRSLIQFHISFGKPCLFGSRVVHNHCDAGTYWGALVPVKKNCNATSHKDILNNHVLSLPQSKLCSAWCLLANIKRHVHSVDYVLFMIQQNEHSYTMALVLDQAVTVRANRLLVKHKKQALFEGDLQARKSTQHQLAH